MILGKILTLGVTLIVSSTELPESVRDLVGNETQGNWVPSQVLAATHIPKSKHTHLAYRIWITPPSAYVLTLCPQTPPQSPILSLSRQSAGITIMTQSEVSVINTDVKAGKSWEKIYIKVDWRGGQATVCVSEWLNTVQCRLVEISGVETTPSDGVITVYSRAEAANSGLQVLDPRVITGSGGDRRLSDLYNTEMCNWECDEGCFGPSESDCTSLYQFVVDHSVLAGKFLPAKGKWPEEMSIEGWFSRKAVQSFEEFISFLEENCADSQLCSRVSLISDSVGRLHLCEQTAMSTNCVTSVELQWDLWAYVTVSMCAMRGFELCVGLIDRVNCQELPISLKSYRAVATTAGLKQYFPDLSFYPACLSLEHKEIRLKGMTEGQGAMIDGRRLATTHYSSFIYRKTMPLGGTHYYTFVNTHTATSSILLTVTRPDGATWGSGVYWYKPYTGGAADWSAIANPRVINITPSDSKIKAKGGDMKGAYTLRLYEDDGYTYTYDVKILIACSATAGTCFCPTGSFPSPTTASCAGCGGVGTCDNTQKLGCIPVNFSTTPPATFSCSTCLSGGLFLDMLTGVCGTCNAVCSACSGISASQCVVCASAGATLAAPPGPSACTCKAGFYPNPGVGNCSNCSSMCATCNAAGATTCTSCKANATLTANPGSCVCNVGFAGTPDNCQPCHLSCLTCNGVATTSCQSCKGIASLAGISPNSCKCPSLGYYANPDARLCSPCNSECVTCSGGSNTQCTSCVATIAKLSGTSPNSCVCNDAYYGTPPNCLPCDSTCSKCANTGASQCTACKTSAHLLTAGTSTCVCNDGYYPGTTAAACKACHATCFNCLDGTSGQCTACKTNATFTSSPGPSSCICLDGFYPNTTPASCPACNPTCLKCVGGSASQCTDCKTNAGLLNGVNPGTCVCLTGYLSNPTSANCVGCDVSCKSCSIPGSSGCTSCNAYATLGGAIPNACVCDTGYYPSAGSCLRCYKTCKTCSGPNPTDCLSCTSPAFLPVGPVPNICDCLGTFDPTCLVCDPTCKMMNSGPPIIMYCVGVGPYDCIACETGAHLLAPLGSDSESYCVCDSHQFPFPTSFSCQPCDSSCDECSGSLPTQCIKCKTNAVLFNSISPGTCICATGFYQNASGNCTSCDIPCKACTAAGSNMCSDCFSNASVKLGSCVCAAGYYPNGDERYCTACDNTCLTCSGGTPIMCDSCFANAKLSAAASSDCVCLTGHFPNPDSQICTQCYSTCVECDGNTANDCTACFSNAELEHAVSPSKCVCSDHTFTLTTSANCQTCDTLCLQCTKTGTTGCSQCYPNASLTGAVPSSCKCNTLYIPAPDVTNCVLCHATCSSCVGSSYLDCTACLSNAGLSVPLTTSACICVDGFYPSPDSSNCKQCYASCKTCDGPGDFECLSCYSNATLDAAVGPTTCLCDHGYFQHPTTKLCNACHISCKHCDTSAANDCTECYLNADLQNNANPSTCACITGAFPFLDERNCIICHATCNGCDGLGPSHCTACFPFAIAANGLASDSCICRSGYYPGPDVANCTPCDQTCTVCVGGTNSDCTACYSNAGIVGGGTGVCECVLGFYGDPDSSNCLPCDFRCLGCVDSGLEFCTQCKPLAELVAYAPFSRCSCEVGSFPNPDASKCSTCHPSCYECSGPTASDCVSCKSFAGLSGAAPAACLCGNGAYPDPDPSACKLCDGTCATCTGPASNQCSSCKVSSFLASSSPSECLCSPGTYPAPDSSNCSPCNPTCETCVDSTDCLTCKANALLSISSCECVPGFFGDPDASNCVQCSAGCQTCDAVACYRCVNPLYVFWRDCVKECPQGYSPSVYAVCEPGDATPPIPILTVTPANGLIVTFDKQMKIEGIQHEDVSVEVRTPDDVTIDTLWSDPRAEGRDTLTVSLTMGVQYLPEKSEVKLTFCDVSKFRTVTGVALEIPFVSGTLNPFGNSDSNATESALGTSVDQQTTVAVQGAAIASGVMSVMSGDPGTLTNLVGSLQLMSYMGMTKINMETDLASTLSALNMGSAFPMPYVDRLRISGSEQSTEDYVNKYGIDSTVFLVNTNTFLGTSLAILASYIPVYLLSKVSHKSISAYFAKLLPSLKWGVPIRLWLTAYLDIGVYSMLQISNSKESLFSPYVSCNLIMAYLFAFGFFATPLAIVLFTYKYSELMADRSSESFNKNWGVLFLEFQKGNKAASVYYAVFVLRRFLFVLSLTLTKEKPHFIAAINCAMALSTFSFMVSSSPFDLVVDHLNSLLTEGGTFLVYLSVSTFLFEFGSTASHILSSIGVWTARITVFGNVLASMYKTGLMVVKVVQGYLQHMKALQSVQPVQQISITRRGKILF